MTKATKTKATEKGPRREGIRKANRAVSRPEDPDTQRQHRAARLLRADEVPMGGAMITQDEDPVEDSTMKSAIKRASNKRSGSSAKS